MGVTDIHSRDGIGLPVTLLEFPTMSVDISPQDDFHYDRRGSYSGRAQASALGLR